MPVRKVGKSYPGQQEPHRDVEQVINVDRDRESLRSASRIDGGIWEGSTGNNPRRGGGARGRPSVRTRLGIDLRNRAANCPAAGTKGDETIL